MPSSKTMDSRLWRKAVTTEPAVKSAGAFFRDNKEPPKPAQYCARSCQTRLFAWQIESALPQRTRTCNFVSCRDQHLTCRQGSVALEQQPIEKLCRCLKYHFRKAYLSGK
jgi:hypothetical protein